MRFSTGQGDFVPCYLFVDGQNIPIALENAGLPNDY
jgi:hypothetical protein